VPLLVLLFGTFMSALDTSIVNVAIPKMQVTHQAAPDDVDDGLVSWCQSPADSAFAWA
jgi:hypothetical protein